MMGTWHQPIHRLVNVEKGREIRERQGGIKWETMKPKCAKHGGPTRRAGPTLGGRAG